MALILVSRKLRIRMHIKSFFTVKTKKFFEMAFKEVDKYFEEKHSKKKIQKRKRNSKEKAKECKRKKFESKFKEAENVWERKLQKNIKKYRII